jgi:predicted flap endonuclease-1-like 5' DNA nuclease
LKKLHFAWIEQVLSFDSDRERAEYIEKQKALAERKKASACSGGFPWQ